LEPRGQETRQITRPWGNPLPPPLGVIEVIHATSRGTLVTRRNRVLTMVLAESCQEPLGKRMKYAREPITFNDEDLEGMT